MSQDIEIKDFENFKVYCYENDHTFLYADFPDKDIFLDGLCDYIMTENNLLNFAKRTSKIDFNPSVKHYKKLYDNISIFLNQELETLEIDEVTDEIKDVLGEEYNFIDDNGVLLVQKDKVGKIGEYIFHILLTNFFELDCVIPKFKCITDRNMSVFGIDSLFLDATNKRIYFGESKFSKNINNGITLVNKSLVEYEQQIKEEYRIILSNDDTFIKAEIFAEIFQDSLDVCVSFEDFLNVSDISSIGIPIFIAHGEHVEKGAEYYLKRLREGLKKKDVFGMETIYIGISFPVVSKAEFVEKIIMKAVNKSDEYRRKVIQLR